ncbi:PREDICTED: zinc finger protein 507 isoform X1 [Poecilia mexicana]|uniref:zinc finger protein 507 isoform X1 n=1 Tax=Poecilia mexicana TaxID=48701 RepID=UPI00072EC1B0|nr:PREDICTED: zinc finger protein 507 isoform X1 [Poecilia mexicana]
MDENCSAVVLISKSSSTSDASSSAPVPGSPFEPQPHRVIGQGVPGSVQPKQVDESLIQVIEKLSKIVEQCPQRRCPLGGQKRGKHLDSSEVRSNPGSSPNKRMKNSCDEEARADGSETDGISSSLALGDNNNNSITTAPSEVAGGSSHIDLKRTVTCYQCSLCPYLSQTLAQLREHLKQHNEQHSDLILMCSECHFTSRDQEQLEAHVKLHFDDRGSTTRTSTEEEGVMKQCGEGERDSEARKSSLDESSDPPKKKKWYSYEEYGLYRCLICSYVCSQQRMLKTHAWKHAGLVDCSYPIFGEEEGGPARQETQVATNSIIPREDLVILSPGLHDQNLQKLPAAIKLQLCVPVATENQQDQYHPSVSHSNEGSAMPADKNEEEGYANKDVSSEEPVVEVQVTTEGDGDMEVDGTQDSSSIPDSLLSSAQKIINSSPNSAGHINVIVERLPSAEDTVMVTKPLLLNQDVDRDKGLLAVKEEEEQEENPVRSVGCVDNSTNSPPVDADCKSPLPKGDTSLRDENIPPTSRKRTHSESLRLHSLAAEALVAMPMRMPELPTSSPKVTLKSAIPQIQNQRISDGTQSRQRASDVEKTAALLDLELCQAKQEELGPLGLVEGDEEGPTTKAGISLSLLTVIERLRERSDQNISDEDILKELQDNAQFQNGAVAAAITGNGAESYVCNIPGIDGLVGPADGGLVDYNPSSERPYRCRLCHYSSGNKGYIKQHLRVHRQRAPYQCPICEHKASDSKDLENHMIYHCKSRMHQCKFCPDAFHYKSQLRSHEREHHSCSSDTTSPTTGTDTIIPVEESERGTDEEGGVPKMYKCDVCNYTSSTYVGVRNHRRIHNSDKPYRCCSCDFATTNMNSLKSHMRRHPQEHQAVQLLEQYRCSLCGYVCSHPPSLKSHMWKHAGDQNYNYEQVNKAINEAISQSSRVSQRRPAGPESGAECPAVILPLKETASSQVGPHPTHTSVTKASLPSDSPPGPPTHPPDSTQGPAQGKRTGPATTGPPTEYCMLLFCCCICGFESTSKERLMEHMKEHEGDIISIILNKEQQQEAEAQAGLQTAE